VAAAFGGGLDPVLNMPVSEIVSWHGEARRQMELRAQATALAVAQLFSKGNR
jgi:hypothetical protein